MPLAMDPRYPHRLALRLGKSIKEIGECMDAYEYEVLWPAYFEDEARRAEKKKGK